MGYFRVTLYLCLKTSLRTKPFVWKRVWLAWKYTFRRNTLSYEWFRMKTRFDSGAKGNWESAYISSRRSLTTAPVKSRFGPTFYTYSQDISMGILKDNLHERWSVPDNTLRIGKYNNRTLTALNMLALLSIFQRTGIINLYNAFCYLTAGLSTPTTPSLPVLTSPEIEGK